MLTHQTHLFCLQSAHLVAPNLFVSLVLSTCPSHQPVGSQGGLLLTTLCFEKSCFEDSRLLLTPVQFQVLARFELFCLLY